MKSIAAVFALLSLVTFGAEIQLIPKPSSLTRSEGSFTFKQSPTIAAPEPLTNEGRLLAAMLAPATGWKPSVSPRPTADITLKLDTTRTDLGEEGYVLQVTPQGVRIEAFKPAGVFYGIQTLRQLLPVEIDSPQPATGVNWSLPCVEIRDTPRFAWRGFMLDSCRHFQSVTTVKRVIDQMARQKLNRLHWHLTEDEAWRVEVPGHPELTDKGAWRSDRENGKDVARYGGFYSVKDIKEIVAYAQQRHLLVYPEIEMPGHSTAAILACPQYGCDGNPVIPGNPGDLGISSFSANGRHSFCPSRPDTYAFLEDVSRKVSDLFETPFIHIGADEVPREQWDKCPRCQAFIEKEQLKDKVGLQQYFGRRMAGFLLGQGKQPIYWGVDLERGIPEGIIVQGWHPGESALAARKGFQTINSDCTGTYFDFPAGAGDTGDDSKWLGRLPIEKVYQFNPIPADLTPEQAKLVLGSEAALWTEYVPEHKVMIKVFPRLFAFSEVVWSERQPRDFKEFQQRMAPHLERLKLMGVDYYGKPPVAHWSPDQLTKPGDNTIEWDVTTAVQGHPGTYQTEFRFQKGQHALEIRSVALWHDNTLISRDTHAGLAGGRHEHSTYQLKVPNAKSGRLVLSATVAGMGGTDSSGAVFLTPSEVTAP
jgi:hexosaminidase